VEGIKEINKFLLKLFIFYFFWLLADNWLTFNLDLFARIWNFFYHIFLSGVRELSILMLQVLGHDIVYDYRSIAIIGSYGIVIGNHCVGFGISYAFAALIVSYPGPKWPKAWFILFGMILIMLCNAGRIAAVTITGFNSGVVLQVEQHNFFNYIIYVLIFLMWLVWVKYILPKTNSVSQNN
jgi:exosortase/archaeosortase family protein